MITTFSLSQQIFPMCGITLVLTALSFLPVLALRRLRSLVTYWLRRRSRSEQSYESFACCFAGQGIPEPLLQGTYRVLTHKTSRSPAFPISPQDSLRQVYGLDCHQDDELADLMQALRTSFQLDFSKPVPAFLPCKTVADLVYLLAARCDTLYLPTDRPCPFTANESEIGQKITFDGA